MSGMMSEWVLWWCLLLQEFALDIHYIKGEYNRVADALSRLNISGECLSSDDLNECYGPTQLDNDLSLLNTATIALEQEKDKGLMWQVKAKQTKIYEKVKIQLRYHTWSRNPNAKWQNCHSMITSTPYYFMVSPLVVPPQ